MASQRFSYVKYDATSVEIQEILKGQFEAVAHLIDALPDSRAKSLVLTHLEEAYMWTGKAIRDDQIKRTGQVQHEPERTNS